LAQKVLDPLNYFYICFVVSGTLFPGLAKIARPSRKSEVRVNFLPSLIGDCNIEGDCSRGSAYFLLG